MLRILKDLINRLFGIKSKEINKQEPALVVDNTQNKQEMSEDDYFSSIEKHFSSETFDEDISEEDIKELKSHFRESIKNKVHPWNFEKNLDFQLKESDLIYYLYMYYITYLDWHEHDLADKFMTFWFEINSGEAPNPNDENFKEALRLLKYEVLGFKTINGSKEEKKEEPVKDLEEFARDIFDAEGLNSKPDILPLLLKEWKAYEEKLLLEEKGKLKNN